MNRRFPVLLLGIAAIIVLGLLLFHHVRQRPAHAHPLFDLAPDAITRLDARWASGKHIALHRGPNGWRMSAPVRAPANATRVGAFLDALSEPVARSYTSSSVPLTSAGLDPARLVLEVNHQKAELGRLNPAGGLRYIRRGQHVFVVADTLLPRLAAGPWQFISTRLIAPGRTVTGVSTGNPPISLDPSAVKAWENARALRVGPPSTPAPAVLGHVRLTLAPPTATTGFNIISRHPLKLTRPGSGLVYTFGPAAASQLLPDRARTSGS